MSINTAPKTFLEHIGLTILLILMLPIGAFGSPYRDHRSLREHLTSLAERNPDLVRLRGIARSLERRRVWAVQIGAGSDKACDHRPAMLVVAGVEGNDLFGSHVALSWIEDLLVAYEDNAESAELLETTTIYVIPRLNPDAAEHFFAAPRVETRVNSTAFDDDRDGLVDEDGPEDLNGDGLITHMRVHDGKGEYALDPVDDRLLVEADPLKEQAAAWRYLIEGTDDDRDGQWNEDGPGGVNLNRNFPFEYDDFAADAGVHPVSESETRALADFVIDHPNIGIVLTYGSADNLLKCPESDSPPERRKPLTKIDEEDVGYWRALGELYRETLGLDEEIENTSHRGTFSDWIYYHRGRLSLAACPWNPDIAIALSQREADSEDTRGEDEEKDTLAEVKEDQAEESADEAEGQTSEDEASEEDRKERNEEERRRLEWFDEHAPDAFIDWQAYEHPDFPGDRVEIGGYRPFASVNPPDSTVADITDKHIDFLTALLHKLPRITVREIEVDHLGDAVYEIEICVENTGFLPTVLSHGERTREVHPTRVELDLDDGRFLSGKKRTNLGPISGSGGTASARCVVHLPDQKEIEVTVVSALGGRISKTIKLIEGQ